MLEICESRSEDEKKAGGNGEERTKFSTDIQATIYTFPSKQVLSIKAISDP